MFAQIPCVNFIQSHTLRIGMNSPFDFQKMPPAIFNIQIKLKMRTTTATVFAFVLHCTLAFSLFSCSGTMPAPSQALFVEKASPLAKKAVENYPRNKDLECQIDPALPLHSVTAPFLRATNQKTLTKPSRSGSEISAGVSLVNVINWKDAGAGWKSGFVLVLAQSVHNAELQWVSCPALLKSESGRVTVKKELITLSKDSDAQYIFIEQ